MTFETAAYTARYVMKKGFGKHAGNFARIDEDTGEIIPLVQPCAAMSLKPAIGREWIEKYHQDIYGHDKDFLIMRGNKMKPAKYYDKYYDTIQPAHMAEIKEQRIDNRPEITDNELRAREKIARARIINRQQV